MAKISNGSDPVGVNFDKQCSECEFGQLDCPIALVQYLYNYDQYKNELASEILEALVSTETGCKMFELIKKEG